MIKASQVKSHMKAQEMRVSKEFIEALAEKVQALVEEAAARAKSAKRQTLKKVDL